MSDINKNCAEYLKKKPTIRIMNGFRRKYESLGKTGGTFVLTNPSDDEKLFLRERLYKDYSSSKSISISLVKFENSFKNTKFDGVVLSQLLEYYFDEMMMTNKERLMTQQQKKKLFFDEILESCPSLHGFIQASMKVDGISYKWLMGLYNQEDVLRDLLIHLERLVNQVGFEEFVVMPVLAAKITKDPHALDDGSQLLNGWLYYLSYVNNVSFPKSAYERSELLSSAGVINNINKLVMTYGFTSKRNAGFKVFYDLQEPLVLTDLNIQDVESINQDVYCFENPSVFMMFIRRFPKKTGICTSGQINQTVYKVLNQLSGNQLYYSGDFDPEGLVIAQKLRKKYHNLELLGYTKEMYLISISDNKLSSRRLNQLKYVDDCGLAEIKMALLEHMKAGYQEYVLDDLFEFIH